LLTSNLRSFVNAKKFGLWNFVCAFFIGNVRWFINC
jgi:hypothetical protein